ncbi:DUF4488 domain-containing protein [Albibacterium indicum]|uniref:DUF4488 domain-containing protein n=1 Tax=Albibacterium indicum TaxID=2292082 RepID=UPI000E4A53DE|nr:DUF4488 domain-containing protein [Pedobacter indicus]
MKKTFLILALGLLLSTFILAQQKENNSIVGMWQLGKAVNNGHEANINNIVQLKQYLDNGDFQAFVSTGPGKVFQTMKGTYQLKNDSVYSETIQVAINPGMVGRTYDILYKVNETQLDLDGKVTIPNATDSSVIDTFSYKEKWNRVQQFRP